MQIMSLWSLLGWFNGFGLVVGQVETELIGSGRKCARLRLRLGEPNRLGLVRSSLGIQGFWVFRVGLKTVWKNLEITFH